MTHEHLGPLVDQPGIEIRLLEMPADYIIHRFDDQLLVILHAVGADPDRGPLMHLRRSAVGGMFGRLAEYYDDLWDQTPEPTRPGLDPAAAEDPDEDEAPETDPRLTVGEPPAAGDSERSASSPRRWPLRPEGPPDHGQRNRVDRRGPASDPKRCRESTSVRDRRAIAPMAVIAPGRCIAPPGLPRDRPGDVVRR
jgi:hypothetical protein